MKNKVSNDNYQYDEFTDDKSIKRDQKKQRKMQVNSAFLKQIAKIQKERFEKKYH